MTKPPHSSSRRPSTDDGPDDAFVSSIFKASGWIRSHRRPVIGAAVAAALAVVAVIYYANYRKTLAVEASFRLESVYQTAAWGDPAEAESGLIQFLSEFDGTPLATEARVLLGQIYVESGRFTEALSILEVDGRTPKSPMSFPAAFLLATAYEAKDRWEDAEETYLRIAARSDLAYERRDALAHAARVRTQEGNLRGAFELYETIVSSFEEGDPEAGLYRMRLAEVEAALSR